MKPVAPLGVPHETLCDTEVLGFSVPARSMVIANILGIHFDPPAWDEPGKFKPERFLDEKGVVINRERMIAFSIGKRACLGELLARQEIFLFLTAILQQFDILPPEGCSRIDYKEKISTTLSPTEYSLRAAPRTVTGSK